MLAFNSSNFRIASNLSKQFGAMLVYPHEPIDKTKYSSKTISNTTICLCFVFPNINHRVQSTVLFGKFFELKTCSNLE